MKKRLLTILLAASMVLMIPAAAFAEDENTQAAETPAVEATEIAEEAEQTVTETPVTEEAAAEEETATQEMSKAVAEETTPEATQPSQEQPAAQTEEPAIETGWNDDRTQYRDEEGNLVKGLFKAKMSDGVGALFYADENGNVVKTQGLITVAYPKTRFLRTTDAEGHVGFRDVGSADQNTYTYLIGEKEGAIVETAKIYTTSKGKVIVQDNGTVKKTAGLAEVDGKLYYVKASGYIRTDIGWKRLDNGNLYRIGKGGVIRTKVGQFKVGSDRYVIKSSDGVVVTKKGPVRVNGKLYFVRSKYGKLGSNKAYKYEDKVYHVNKYGAIKVDKHKWKDGKYYFATKWGYLKTKTGFVSRNGYRFLVKKGGLVVVSQKFKYKGNLYIANKYGSVKTGMFKWKGTLYYADDKGKLKKDAGIIEYKGYDYLVTGNGVVAVNKMSYYKGDLYASDSNGHLLTGIFKRGNTYYYAKNDYKVDAAQEIITYKGNYYYNKKGGGLARNEWVNVGDKHYYAGDNAAFRTSTFTISGVTFHPSSTGSISDSEYKKLFPDPEEDEAGDNVEDID